jgi:L-ascorbate metabolism protein UlaG (beta-lactamase superfamily)
MRFTYIGGPTALLEVSGLRLLTDPTFDSANQEYPTGVYTLRKTAAPALSPESLGRIDAVLLSHDHHFDNLDHAGRALLDSVETVLTTPAGAERLGDHALGLANWQSVDLPTRDGRVLRVTGTPARHGPVGRDRGPVTGFVLVLTESPRSAVYISGDTVWYEGVAEVSQHFSVQVAILFMGAARVLEVGPAHLTLTAAEAVEAARVFAEATIVPLHYEGWAHYSESREQIEVAFASAGLEHRLRWIPLLSRDQVAGKRAQGRQSSTGSRARKGRSGNSASSL